MNKYNIKEHTIVIFGDFFPLHETNCQQWDLTDYGQHCFTNKIKITLDLLLHHTKMLKLAFFNIM